MKPSEICKAAGFTLAELSAESGESVQHLINTAKKKPRTFELLVLGLAAERNRKKLMPV